MTQADLINTITNVLGLSIKQREVLSDDGYDTIFTIILMKYDKIREWCITKSKLTTTIAGGSYGDKKTKCLQELARWANDLTLRGNYIVLDDFDATTMADCIGESNLDY